MRAGTGAGTDSGTGTGAGTGTITVIRMTIDESAGEVRAETQLVKLQRMLAKLY